MPEAPARARKTTVSELLATADMFADLPPATRADLAAGLRLIELGPGERLFETGELGDAVYFVLEGRIALESDGVSIAGRGPGECVGEFALVDRGPRSTAARALEHTRLARWPRAAFRAALARYPGLTTGLFRLLTAKLREDVDARVGHALEQQRWELEMHWAREVQQGLLPAPHAALAGVELACACEPAGHVGGDLYDYVSLGAAAGGRGAAVMVADVTGHGVHSALLAAMAKSCLHNQVLVDPSPGAVTRALAGTVELSLGRRLLMSVAYAHIESGVLTYANAGHPPILHVRHAGGPVAELEALDPILGVVEPAAFPAHEAAADLAAGDLLVLYTDGVTEARNGEGEQFGIGRLEAVLTRDRYSSASTCREAVLDAVHGFTGGVGLDDDLTLVVVRAA